MQPTVTLELGEQEVALLQRALDAYLNELRFEASRAEQREAKHELWSLEHELERLRARLVSRPPAPR